MGYIPQTYNPFVVSSTETTIDKIHKLADLALRDIFPGESYSNFEVQIWVTMRELVEKTLDSRNHYKTVGNAKQVLQKIHVL